MAEDLRESRSEFAGTLYPGMTAKVLFRITEGMVKRFSEITGDYSPLHSNREFARKSPYRQQVVHGMLPVAYISCMGFFQREGLVCVPIELTGQFIEPVYMGDELSLSAEVTNIIAEDAHITCKYSIEKYKTGVVAARGTVTVIYTQATKEHNIRKTISTNASYSMVTGHIQLEERKLEEISVRDTDGFRFLLSENTMDILLKTLFMGISSEVPFDFMATTCRFYFPNLMAILLYSPSVGMCIPGKYATFLGFESRIDKPISTNTNYCLKGEVIHVSNSTRIIKKNIGIFKSTDGNEVHGSGKVSILVNDPPSIMPDIGQLKDSALDMGLKEKIVLITGASRGIGETTAKLFSLYGAKVIINYFKGEVDAQRIACEIVREGGDALAIQADVSNLFQVRNMVRKAVERYGSIDVLVNNAVRDFRPVEFLRLTWEEVQQDIDVVVKGAFYCCKEVIPLMLTHGGGRIINIGTIATEDPPANQLKYVIAKSGLVGLTRSLSRECAAGNILVNMVIPNLVETDLIAHIPDVYRKKIANETPIQRNATPVDVAQAVVFLASSFSSYTTGQRLMITGGGVPYL